MKLHFLVALIGFGGSGLILFDGNLSWANGTFIPPKPALTETSTELNAPEQKVIIFHDGQTEHLILQAKYFGNVKEFAWVVPVPAYPKSLAVKQNVFEEISQFFYSLDLEQKEWEQRYNPKTSVAPPAPDSSADRLAPGAPPFSSPAPPQEPILVKPPVSLLEVKKVGPYELSILASTEANALANWLNSHNYQLPKGAETVLQYYIERKMFFVAMRVDIANNEKKPVERMIGPVLLTFKCEDIYYPLKITSLNKSDTKIDICLFSKKDNLSYTGQKRHKLFQINREVRFSRDSRFSIKSKLPNCVKVLPELTSGAYVLTRMTSGQISAEKMPGMEDVIFATTLLKSAAPLNESNKPEWSEEYVQKLWADAQIHENKAKSLKGEAKGYELIGAYDNYLQIVDSTRNINNVSSETYGKNAQTKLVELEKFKDFQQFAAKLNWEDAEFHQFRNPKMALKKCREIIDSRTLNTNDYFLKTQEKITEITRN